MMNYERFSKFTVLLTTVAENFMNLLYNRIVWDIIYALHSSGKKSLFGVWKNEPFYMSPDFDEPLEDFSEYM